MDVPSAYRLLSLLSRKSKIPKFHTRIWWFQRQRRIRTPFHLLRLAVYLGSCESVRDTSESPGTYSSLVLEYHTRADSHLLVLQPDWVYFVHVRPQ
jgi:hypothetical protein